MTALVLSLGFGLAGGEWVKNQSKEFIHDGHPV